MPEGNCYNALKIRMDKVRSVSEAIALSVAARECKFAVIVGCGEDGPETGDTFSSDLAVGLGAGQFTGGGLESGEYCAGYNRLMEIQREAESISFVRRYFRT